MTNPAGRNLVILGANSEIGRVLARRASKKDCRMLLVSRSTTPSMYDNGAVQSISGVDLTLESDLVRLQIAVDTFFGEPFSVIHSVGDFWVHKPLVETSFSEIRRMCESHYLSFCGAAHSLIPVMVRKGGGRIVALSCNSVTYNYPDMAPFTSAKAAVESFIRCIAHEYAEANVTAAALALPTIRTERVLQEKPGGDHANYLSPEELAEVLLEYILCLPHTVNGNTLKIFKHSRSFYGEGYFERNPRRNLEE